MVHLTKALRTRLLEQAGIFDRPAPVCRDIEWAYKTQWSAEFEKLMRNRLAVGFLRWGDMHHRRADEHKDNVGYALKSLRKYLDTGNKEHLVDAANMCLVEFVAPSCHSSPYFSAIDRK